MCSLRADVTRTCASRTVRSASWISVSGRKLKAVESPSAAVAVDAITVTLLYRPADAPLFGSSR